MVGLPTGALDMQISAYPAATARYAHDRGARVLHHVSMRR